jgi:hypothetical protein
MARCETLSYEPACETGVAKVRLPTHSHACETPPRILCAPASEFTRTT